MLSNSVSFKFICFGQLWKHCVVVSAFEGKKWQMVTEHATIGMRKRTFHLYSPKSPIRTHFIIHRARIYNMRMRNNSVTLRIRMLTQPGLRIYSVKRLMNPKE